jgi:hypothetical protein
MNVSISAPMPIEYVISSWRENRSSKTRVIISRHCDHLNCTFFHNHAVFPMRMRQSVCGQTYWNLNDLRRTDLLWWIRVTVRVTLDAGAIFVIVQDVAGAKRQTAAAYRYREYLNPSSDNKKPRRAGFIVYLYRDYPAPASIQGRTFCRTISDPALFGGPDSCRKDMFSVCRLFSLLLLLYRVWFSREVHLLITPKI